MGPSCSVEPQQSALDLFAARVHIECSAAQFDRPIKASGIRFVVDGALDHLEVGGVKIVAMTGGPLLIFEIQRKPPPIAAADEFD